MNNKESLEHVGVLGMHWGSRKAGRMSRHVERQKRLVVTKTTLGDKYARTAKSFGAKGADRIAEHMVKKKVSYRRAAIHEYGRQVAIKTLFTAGPYLAVAAVGAGAMFTTSRRPEYADKAKALIKQIDDGSNVWLGAAEYVVK